MTSSVAIPATYKETVDNYRHYITIIRQMMEDNILKEGIHYGAIPGAEKPALLQPGAQLLCATFELSPVLEFAREDSERDYEKLIFDFVYNCSIYRRSDHVLMAKAQGSCSSLETKYGYRWVTEGLVPAGLDKTKLHTRNSEITEFAFAIEKGETSGQYGKPAEYWKAFRDAIEDGTAVKTTKKTKKGESDAWSIGGIQYRIPNPEVGDLLNTMRKMAQKRAFIAAILNATGASDIFTQDVEDMPQFDVATEIVRPDWNELEAIGATVLRESYISKVLENLQLQNVDSNLWVGKTTEYVKNLIGNQICFNQTPVYPISVVAYKRNDEIRYRIDCGFFDAFTKETFGIPELERATNSLGEIISFEFPAFSFTMYYDEEKQLYLINNYLPAE